MSSDHPDFPLFKKFVDGQLEEAFYHRYVRYMSEFETDTGAVLNQVSGPLPRGERTLLREASKPMSRNELARSLRKMSRDDRAGFAELVLAGVTAIDDICGLGD